MPGPQFCTLYLLGQARASAIGSSAPKIKWLSSEIERVFEANYGVYGARKVCKAA